MIWSTNCMYISPFDHVIYTVTTFSYTYVLHITQALVWVVSTSIAWSHQFLVKHRLVTPSLM